PFPKPFTKEILEGVAGPEIYSFTDGLSGYLYVPKIVRYCTAEQHNKCPNDDAGLFARCSRSRKALRICINIPHTPLSFRVLCFPLFPYFLAPFLFSNETATLTGRRSCNRHPEQGGGPL
ncbi:hypothetical protein KI387_012108, partial [Taxus chinensis]